MKQSKTEMKIHLTNKHINDNMTKSHKNSLKLN